MSRSVSEVGRGVQFGAGIVVNTGRRAYTREDGIALVPAVLLGP